jgi:hypothetical protein
LRSTVPGPSRLTFDMRTPALNFDSVGLFLRSDAKRLHEWVTRSRSRLVWFCVTAIVVGAGPYGAVMGSWRDGWQALYTGIKLPLVILLTTLGNGLLNGMLAPLLGLNLGFRQSLVLVLISFAIASLILGALSPVALFVVWNTPPLTAGTRLSSPEYGVLQLTLAGFLAFAGILGNLRLLPLLRQWTNKAAVARRVLLAWLAGNLFLGSQICWVLRPFIWDPAGPVEFIGRQYFHGSFYETVFEAARRLVWS